MNKNQQQTALEGLRPISAGDLERYKAAVTQGQQVGFAYYFPSLLAKHKPGVYEILIEDCNDSLCLYRRRSKEDKQQLDILFAPMPMKLSALQHCIDRVHTFNGNQRARILKIDEKDAERLDGIPRVSIRKRRGQYLYDPDSFKELAGRRYRTVRRNINKVEALPDVRAEPYTHDHYDACRTLLKRWRDHHREKHGTQGGFGTSRRLLKLVNSMTSPDVIGEVIFVQDELVAFAFGGEIRPGVGAFLEAKSAPEITGLSYYQRYSFLKKQNLFEFINDGSDTGREGLRQLKESLRPVGIHTEYSASFA